MIPDLLLERIRSRKILLPIECYKDYDKNKLIDLVKNGYDVRFFGFGRRASIIWEVNEKGELHIASSKVIK